KFWLLKAYVPTSISTKGDHEVVERGDEPRPSNPGLKRIANASDLRATSLTLPYRLKRLLPEVVAGAVPQQPRGVRVEDAVDLLGPTICSAPFTTDVCPSSDAQDDVCLAGKDLDSLLSRMLVETKDGLLRSSTYVIM
ncbi:hypothetical protein CPC08DRAFT_731634, partial [Agrocybe pediades]